MLSFFLEKLRKNDDITLFKIYHSCKLPQLTKFYCLITFTSWDFVSNVYIVMICFLVGDVINLEIKDTLNHFEEVQIKALY